MRRNSLTKTDQCKQKLYAKYGKNKMEKEKEIREIAK